MQKSSTVDEQSKLFRGAAYLTEGATQFLLGHPLFGSSFAATGTLLEPELRVGVEQPFWESGNWSLAGDAFLWQLNPNPQRIIFLGRLPIIFAALLLGGLVMRWGRELDGRRVGLVAMGLLLLDPNVVAHGRLVTGDLLLTAFFVVTVYGFWLAGRSEKRWGDGATGDGAIGGGLVLAGVGLGLASGTKFNAVLLLPILAGLALVWALKRRSWRPFLYAAFVVFVGGLVIVAFYRFALRPLPGGAFWNDFFWVLEYFSDEHGAYLFGRVSPTGWWYYFPVAFLLKTPLPTLFLLGWAVVIAIRQRRETDKMTLWFLLLPVTIYLVAAMTSSLNIGYRHLLPMLPFLFLFTAVQVQSGKVAKWQGGRVPPRRYLPVAFLAWLLLISVTTFPHFIPYFNELAGGSDNGWRLLSDSNVDWGQDLPALAQWQRESGTPHLLLSYFGTAYPSAYGIAYSHIPTWGPTPEQGDPTRQAYNPTNPAPGVYAISVNHLHGVVLGDDREFYATFREREPIAKVGNSIFIYEVLPNGERVNVVYAGLRPSILHPDLQFESNDVQIRWLDGSGGVLWPSDGGWLLTNSMPEDRYLKEVWPETAVTIVDGQALYQLPPPPTLTWFSTPTTFMDTITFLGVDVRAKENGAVTLLTAWRSERPFKTPHQIFVHALDADGTMLGQWDGVSSDVMSWNAGDQFVQLHTFGVGDQEAVSQLLIGVYDPQSGVRLGEILIDNVLD